MNSGKMSITRRSLSTSTRSGPSGPARTVVPSPFGCAQDKLRRGIYADSYAKGKHEEIITSLYLHNRADCGFELLWILGAYEQFFAGAENKLDAFIAFYVIRPAVSEAVSNPPAAIFPYGFILPGVTFAQIFTGEPLEIDVEREKTNVQAIRPDLGLKLHKQKKGRDNYRYADPDTYA